MRAGYRDVLVSFSSTQCLTLSNRQVRMTMRKKPRFWKLDGLPRVSHSGVTQHWSSQLYEAANSKVRCGQSQVTTVFRGAPLDYSSDCDVCEDGQAQYLLFFNLKFFL